MPESWRGQLRDYRDRWIIGIAVVLSILIHVALIVMVMTGILSLGGRAKPKTIDFDLANIDQKMLDEAARQQQPERMLYNRVTPTDKAPMHAEASGFANHEEARPSHLANKPINEMQRERGARGQGQGARQPGPTGGGQPRGPRGKTPELPPVGESVGGERVSNESSSAARSPTKDNINRSVSQMMDRVGMTAPPGGSGGEDGVNPYNPNVGEPGSTVSISTKELRYMGYFAHMRDKIYLAWVYPQEAQHTGQQGVSVLRFTILHSGQVSECEVIKTSGYRLLDQYAVKAVREANFNPMPDDWPDKELTISAAFHYQLIGSGFVN